MYIFFLTILIPVVMALVVTGLVFFLFIIPLMKQLLKLRGPGGTMKDPISGILRVTACSYPSRRAIYANCTIIGVIEAPGMAAVSFQRPVIAKVSKWPQVGMALPVLIDRQNPQLVKIMWHQVEDLAQQAARQAQEMADAINRRSTQ